MSSSGSEEWEGHCLLQLCLRLQRHTRHAYGLFYTIVAGERGKREVRALEKQKASLSKTLPLAGGAVVPGNIRSNDFYFR